MSSTPSTPSTPASPSGASGPFQTTNTGRLAGAPASAKTVSLTIDGKSVTVPERTSVWEAARQAGVSIPALCHKEDLNPVAVCRVCVVDVLNNGGGRPDYMLAASCARECVDKMEISTTTPRVEQSRRTLIELLLSEHPRPCKRHQETHDCELELIGEKLGILKPIYTPRAYSKGTDTTNFSIAIDHSACILCDRCARACTDVAKNLVIGRMGKGSKTSIAFDNDKKMGESSCVNCGWCMVSCPTGAITYSAGAATGRVEGGTPLAVEDLMEIPFIKQSKVSPQFLKRSEGGVVVKQFKKGEIICRQGEFGHTAFYIDSGKVNIYLVGDFRHVRTKTQDGFFKKVVSFLTSKDQDKRQEESRKRTIPVDADLDLDYDQPLATVGEGELIGEAACLNHQPRSATVMAAEDTVVLEMQRNVLDILRRNRKFRGEMEQKYRERALQSHLRTVEAFKELPVEYIDYLRDRVNLVSYEPKQQIFNQGDPADAFYLVRMGHVKVVETYADGRSIVLSYLGRSQFFGEIGLLRDVNRTASCSALDHVELVKISKEDFAEMMRRFPDIRERLQTVADEREANNSNRDTLHRTVSLQQFIDQGLFQAQSLLILDLEKCTRCDECVRACAQAHDGITRLIRDGLRYDKYLVTTSCRSCRDPYCLVGCPVDAIHRKKDLQIIIEDHCIGCRNCANNCPYGNISMHEFDAQVKNPESQKMEWAKVEKAAVCDLCTDQCLDEDEEPSCVYACPHDAAHRVDGKQFFESFLKSDGKRDYPRETSVNEQASREMKKEQSTEKSKEQSKEKARARSAK